MTMRPPRLFIMLGLPGAGKSTFAVKLAEHLNIPILIADTLRQQWIENPRWDKQEHAYVFERMDGLAASLLEKGTSVLFDANHNKHRTRMLKYDFARHHGAQPVLLWVSVPGNVLNARAALRMNSGGSAMIANEKLNKTFGEILNAMRYQFQAPSPEEPTIRIDGLLPFERQLQQFEKGIKELP